MGMRTLNKVNWNTAASQVLKEVSDEEQRSNRWISEKTGIPEVSVQRYLAGTRNPPVEIFVSIARALGRDPWALYQVVESRVQGNQ